MTRSLFLLLLSSAGSMLLGQSSYPYVIRTVAGAYPLGDGGPATSALLDYSTAVVADRSGNLYIADGNGHGIRKVTADGTITAFNPTDAADLKMDSAGNLYFSDGYASVYKLSSDGVLKSVAGGTYGYTGDGAPAIIAKLGSPSGLALDSAGNLYIADTDNCRVRMVSPDGKIQTVAGNGTIGFSGDGGHATGAPVNYPVSVAVDANGNLYIGEMYRIRKVTGGLISTIAGNGTSLLDGQAVAAAIGATPGIAVDASGNLFIADSDYSLVRVIQGIAIKTVAGTGKPGFTGDGGPAVSAQIDTPVAIGFDASGNYYIVDQRNARIRKVTTSGTTTGPISTVVGKAHYGGDGGAATAALMHLPENVIGDAAGNLYFSDLMNHRVRKIASNGTVTTVAGTGLCGYSGDNGQAAAAALCFPAGLAMDISGNLYIADSLNSVIRRVDTAGVIKTWAGNGNYADSGDGGQATAAAFRTPFGLALDGAGSLYVADFDANRVRKITAGGVITGFAGSANAGFSGDGTIATGAKLNGPMHLAVDGNSNVYIADYYNYRIRKVSGGIISTIAGMSTCCGTGQNALNAYLGRPRGLTVDSANNLYVSEPNLEQIAKIGPTGSYTVIAGGGYADFTGDGGVATKAQLNAPAGLWVDSSGSVYLADRQNSRIRVISPDDPTGIAIQSGDGQSGTVGTALAAPIIVKVAFRAGVPLTGTSVSFAVTSGSATLSAGAGATDANGNAGVAVTLGNTPGPVVVAATLGTFPPVQFHLTANTSVPLPTITAGGIVGAGGSVPPLTQISPGGIDTIYGVNLAPAGTSQLVQTGDYVNGSLPTNVAGVCVTVDGTPAFLTFVSPGQINFQVPSVTVGASVKVQVITNCGTASALTSAVQSVTTQAATPEFLYWVKNANGQNPIIAVNAVTGGYVAAAGLIAGATFTPAKPQDILTIYGIGFGPTDPAIPPGTPSSTVAPTVNKPAVTLGSVTLDPSDVLYAGISPGSPGLYQLNIRVPNGLADGDYPLQLTLGSFKTPAGGFLTVKN